MVKLMLHHAILIGKKVNNRNPSNEATAIKPSSGKTFPFKSLPPSKRKVKNYHHFLLMLFIHVSSVMKRNTCYLSVGSLRPNDPARRKFIVKFSK